MSFLFNFLCHFYVIYMHSTRINILNLFICVTPAFFNTILSHIFIDTTSSSILQFKEPEQIIQQMGMLGNCQRLP